MKELHEKGVRRATLVGFTLLLFLGALSAVPIAAAQSGIITFSATFVSATPSEIQSFQNIPLLELNAVGYGWGSIAYSSLPYSVNSSTITAYGFYITPSSSWSLGYLGSGSCPAIGTTIQGGADGYAEFQVNASTPNTISACYYPTSSTTPPPSTNSTKNSAGITITFVPMFINGQTPPTGLLFITDNGQTISPTFTGAYYSYNFTNGGTYRWIGNKTLKDGGAWGLGAVTSDGVCPVQPTNSALSVSGYSAAVTAQSPNLSQACYYLISSPNTQPSTTPAGTNSTQPNTGTQGTCNTGLFIGPCSQRTEPAGTIVIPWEPALSVIALLGVAAYVLHRRGYDVGGGAIKVELGIVAAWWVSFALLLTSPSLMASLPPVDFGGIGFPFPATEYLLIGPLLLAVALDIIIGHGGIKKWFGVIILTVVLSIAASVASHAYGAYVFFLLPVALTLSAVLRLKTHAAGPVPGASAVKMPKRVSVQKQTDEEFVNEFEAKDEKKPTGDK